MTAFVSDGHSWVAQEDYVHPSCQACEPTDTPRNIDTACDRVERAFSDVQRDTSGVQAFIDEYGVITITFDELRADISALQDAIAHYLGAHEVSIEFYPSDGYMTVVAH